MGVSHYKAGSRVRLKSYDADGNGFAGSTGAAADPTTVTLRVMDPTGTITSYATADLTKVTTGQYYLDVTMSTAGRWHYEYTGTGAVIAAEWGELEIEASPVPTT